MESNVRTKVPESRRTKYVILGLLACICVLSYLLYQENVVKKELVRRKSFYISKLYDCRTSSEETAAKLKVQTSENEQLMTSLTTKQNALDESQKKFEDLENSYNDKTLDLQKLQKTADDDKYSLSELRESYDNAMLSIKHMQRQLNLTIMVCDKFKKESQLLNRTVAEKINELELCKQEKTSLEAKSQVLFLNEQDLKKKVAEMETLKTLVNLDPNAGQLNPAASIATQPQSSVFEHAKHNALTNSVQSIINEGQHGSEENTPIQAKQITQTFQQPVAQNTRAPSQKSVDSLVKPNLSDTN